MHRHPRAERREHAHSTPSFSSSDLKYSTKAELVYRRLREEIVNGVLLPGTHLHLQEIGTSLGVSTVPVREALRRLESEGLVSNRPHAGATVATIDVEKIEVHFMVRGALEGLAVRLAAAHVTEDELEQLADLHARLRRLVRDGDFLAWNDVNIAFYRRLFDCSHSAELIDMIELQRDRSPRFRHFPDVLAARAGEANATRHALLQALQARNGATAEHIHRQHVTRTGQMLCAAMQRHVHPPANGQAPTHESAARTRHELAQIGEDG